MKKTISILMTIVGILIFLSLYVLVSLVTEDEFSGLRYVVMAAGYIAVILFCCGFLLLNKKDKKE